MKTLVVGDIHGRVEAVERALATGFPVVFVGDYLDSYVRYVDEQIKSMRMVIDAIKAGKAVGLKANHELSYLSEGMQCSGFNAITYMRVKEEFVYTGDIKLLKDYHWCEGFLISHAGVSQSLLDHYKISLDDYLARENKHEIGYSRGGRSPCGGIYWCDWKDDFEAVEGVKQIVGHTHGKKIREKDGNYCIDVLTDNIYDKQIGLLIENGQVEEFEF